MNALIIVIALALVRLVLPALVLLSIGEWMQKQDRLSHQQRW
jgi:hypothetical protein